LQALGSVARERGLYTRAEAYHGESMALWHELGDDGESARLLNSLGFVAWLQEKYDRVGELCTEPLKMFRRMGDVQGSVWALINLGSAALYGGDLRRAETLLKESLAISRRAGYSEGIPWSLNQLGVAAYRRGDYEQAEALLRESLKVHHNLGDRWRMSSVLEGLAEAACAQGHLERAAQLFGAAEALRETIAAPIPPCERADHARNLSVALAGLGEEVFARARTRGRAMTLEEASEYALSEEEPSTTALSSASVRPSATSIPEHPAGLTSREVEVLKLVASGMTSAQVAEELSLSRCTVDTHLTSIYRKLGVNSRAAAIRFALERGLA
jgi:ATP/maltotriose-dependent transcriptional regulator MalT